VVSEEPVNFSARFSAACLSFGKKVKNENGVSFSLAKGLSAVTSGNKVVVLKVVSIGIKLDSVVLLEDLSELRILDFEFVPVSY
jgi:hypothetical protein